LTDIATTTQPRPSLGESLRALRTQKGLSLGDVASATDISRSFLSLVETGKSDITIGRLTRLLDYFGVSLADLLPAANPADPEIVRPAERRQLHSETEGIDFFLLAPDTRREMMPMIVQFAPAARLAEHGKHRGEEFIIVLAGELELELEGSVPRRLRAGDSAYYSAERPHRFRNASNTKPLRVLCVDTPPNL
jgi:quercetin dioxygenase-like cupin family protein/DNA-binding Xre family transcriptional regulator